MLPLNQLLERFKSLTNTEKVKKQLVIEIMVSKNLPVTIDQISISKNIIFLKVRPIIKTEALLKREELLKEIQKIPGLTTIQTIQ